MSVTGDLTNRIALLSGHEFFRDLDREAIARIAATVRFSRAKAGHTIFTKGDPGHGLVAVIDGLVKISALAPDGREVVLNLIGQNQLFGEIALLDGLPRTADATAVVDCRLLVLERRDFKALLRAEPAIGLRLLEIVGRRLRRTTEQVEQLSFSGATERLAATLLRLANLRAPADDPCLRIDLTQREIGQAAGLSRETTNKQLRSWARAGLVKLEKASCTILRPSELAQAQPPQ